MFLKRHQSFMQVALDQAKACLAQDEVPVGAVLVHDASDAILFQGGNQMQKKGDPLAHAEVLAIKAGQSALKNPFLDQCTLYVTLEPCLLCAAAVSYVRLKQLVFGAYNPKAGGVVHSRGIFAPGGAYYKPVVVEGVGARESEKLLKAFFNKKRPSVTDCFAGHD